jgi:GNAT superfamily N-acetyltransferase
MQQPQQPAAGPVHYHDPSTGQQRAGQVTGQGAQGVTVVDQETGQTHKIEHGRWRHRGPETEPTPSKTPPTPSKPADTDTDGQVEGEWSPPERTGSTSAHPKAMAFARNIFGEDVSPEHIAALGGVLPDIDVTIEPGMTPGSIAVTGHPPGGGLMGRAISRENSDIVIDNLYFELPEESQGKGLGARALLQQVQTAGEMGISRIDAEAARNDAEGMVGYYVWPRLGYDAELPDAAKEETGAERVSDLMKHSHGRAWWKEHGDTIHMSFDPSEGSQSRRALEAYAEAKGIEGLAKAVQRAIFGDLHKGRKDEPRDKAGRWERAPRLDKEDDEHLDRVWDDIGREDAKKRAQDREP